MTKQKKPHISDIIYGSGEFDYDDSILEMYGIDEDGNMDKEATKAHDEFMKSIANNPKRSDRIKK
ncbi:MAG: hypothetical protein PHW03_06645 [Eubacteriales bacterium]|nr:hypothetical protein [Eubacteriales bacterium]MDD4390465.1 hypothetical protein [Eubacteriales bacterium]